MQEMQGLTEVTELRDGEERRDDVLARPIVDEQLQRVSTNHREMRDLKTRNTNSQDGKPRISNLPLRFCCIIFSRSKPCEPSKLRTERTDDIKVDAWHIAEMEEHARGAGHKPSIARMAVFWRCLIDVISVKDRFVLGTHLHGHYQHTIDSTIRPPFGRDQAEGGSRIETTSCRCAPSGVFHYSTTRVWDTRLD